MRATERLGFIAGGGGATGPAAWSALSCVDRGVHARSFWVATPVFRVPLADVPVGQPSTALASRLQGTLPPSLRVPQALPMPAMAEFHHSRSAASREYRYYLPARALGAGRNLQLRAALKRFV